jgi:uncharacterized protein HemX
MSRSSPQTTTVAHSPHTREKKAAGSQGKTAAAAVVAVVVVVTALGVAAYWVSVRRRRAIAQLVASANVNDGSHTKYSRLRAQQDDDDDDDAMLGLESGDDEEAGLPFGAL